MNRKVIKRSIALFFALVIAICCCFQVGKSFAIGADSEPDFGFYNLASNIAIFIDASLAPDHDTGVIQNKANLAEISTMSQGGSACGYADKSKDFAELMRNFVTSAMSGSSQTYAFAMYTGSLDTSGSQGIRDYMRYGCFLKKLGLDRTGGEFSGKMSRMIYGGILYFAYYLASVVPYLFSCVIVVLQKFNPFYFFGNIADFNHHGINDPGSRFYPILETIGAYYRWSYNLAKNAMVLLWIVILAGGFFLSKNFNTRESFKRFAIRVLFIFGMFPFLAGCYTATLDSLKSEFDDTNMATTRIIAAELVDFAGWAENTNLNFPEFDHAGYVCNPSTPDVKPYGSTWANLPNIAYQINVLANPDAHLDPTYRSPIDKPKETTVARSEVEQDFKGKGSPQANLAASLIERYMSGDLYSASIYEQKIKGEFDTSSSDEIKEMFDTFKDPTTLDLSSSVMNKELINGGSMKTAIGTHGLDSCGEIQYGSSGKGLSPLATYNYLSSSFQDHGVIVYSNEQAASAAIKKTHYSVNHIGTGFLGLLFWLNTVGQLLSYAIIGWCYALVIAGRNFKNGIEAMMASFPAMLGSIRNIAKLVTLIVVMISEVFATILMYSVMSNLVLTLPIMMDDLFASIVLKAFGYSPTNLLSGTVGTFLIALRLLFSFIFTVLFLFWALKVRKTVIKGFEDWINDTFSKFFSVEKTPGLGSDRKDSGLMPAVAAGAGMAAVSHFQNRPQNTKNKNDAVEGIRLDGSSKDKPDEEGNANKNNQDANDIFNEDSVSEEEQRDLGKATIVPSERRGHSNASGGGEFEDNKDKTSGQTSSVNLDKKPETGKKPETQKQGGKNTGSTKNEKQTRNEKQSDKKPETDKKFDTQKSDNKDTGSAKKEKQTKADNTKSNTGASFGKQQGKANQSGSATQGDKKKSSESTKQSNNKKSSGGTNQSGKKKAKSFEFNDVKGKKNGNNSKPVLEKTPKDTKATQSQQGKATHDQGGHFEDVKPSLQSPIGSTSEAQVVTGRMEQVSNDAKQTPVMKGSSSEQTPKMNVRRENAEISALKTVAATEPNEEKRSALNKRIEDKQQAVDSYVAQKKQDKAQKKQRRVEAKAKAKDKKQVSSGNNHIAKDFAKMAAMAYLANSNNKSLSTIGSMLMYDTAGKQNTGKEATENKQATSQQGKTK